MARGHKPQRWVLKEGSFVVRFPLSFRGLSSSKSSIDFDKASVGSGYGSQFMLDTDFSKKPPARLKPLVHHGRRNSVIKGINHPAKEVPTAVMSGSSLTQCVAFSNEHGASLEDKSM